MQIQQKIRELAMASDLMTRSSGPSQTITDFLALALTVTIFEQRHPLLRFLFFLYEVSILHLYCPPFR